MTADDEIIDFLAAGTTPASLVDFRPSEETTRGIPALLAAASKKALHGRNPNWMIASSNTFSFWRKRALANICKLLSPADE